MPYKTSIIKLLLNLLLFLTCLPSFSQKSMLEDKAIHEIIKKGLDKSYNFEFEQANEYYEQVRKKYPNHPAYNFLKANNLYWEMLYLDSYKEHSQDYFNYLQASLLLASKFLEKNNNDVEGIFFTMAVESSIALYYGDRDDYMKTLTHAKKAYGFMKQGFTLKEKYADFYFSTGIYDYFVIQYPETHPFYKPFMFFFVKGDKKRGIKELEYGNEKGIFSGIECLHYLTHIFLKYENDPEKALTYSNPLVRKYPNNYYFIARHVENLIASQRFKEAEIYAYKLFATGKKAFIMRSYIFYGMLNEKHFKKPDEAMKYYNSAVKLAKELNQPVGDYFAYAYAGIARLYQTQGKTAQAVLYYKKVKEIAEYVSLKKEAEEYLNKYH
jgi:tetratricopeptide (TPR) repeat protein